MILAINGSPRPHRNTASLMKLVISEMKRLKPGAEATWCNLNDMTYSGCQSCLACKDPSAKGCAHKDSLAFVLDLMITSKVWIIGTPVYMGSVSGQLKLLMDRMYGFMGPNRQNRIPPGKKVLVAITQGRGEDGHPDLPRYLENFFSRRGLDVRVLRSCNMQASSPVSELDENVREKAAEAAKWLLS